MQVRKISGLNASEEKRSALFVRFPSVVMKYSHVWNVLKGDPVHIGTKHVFRIVARTHARARAKVFVKRAKALDQCSPHGQIAPVELARNVVVPRRIQGAAPALGCRTGVDGERQIRRIAKLDASTAQYKISVSGGVA